MLEVALGAAGGGWVTLAAGTAVVAAGPGVRVATEVRGPQAAASTDKPSQTVKTNEVRRLRADTALC
jgi:hypothetical protein